MQSINLKQQAEQFAGMRESVAAMAHEIWMGWMAYQNTKGVKNADGSFTINADSYARWMRQANTDYADLPDKERESDREIADRYIALLGSTIE